MLPLAAPASQAAGGGTSQTAGAGTSQGAGAATTQAGEPGAAPVQAPVQGERVPTAAQAAAAVTDAQRGALTMTAYNLTVHLRPAEAKLSVLARVTVRNDGATPLTKLPMQLSSTLHWDGISGRTLSGGTPGKLAFDQHEIDTDADHTGKASEAVVSLPEPLAPGAALELTTFYSGRIVQAAVPLERAGAPPEEAALVDWDAVGPEGTALRGFGHVLWYPVASPQIFLGDGARFAERVGQVDRRESGAAVRLRLEVEGNGVGSGTAYFCGRGTTMAAVNEETARGGEADAAETAQVWTTEVPEGRLAFGGLSLFLTPTSAVQPEGVVRVISTDDAAAARVSQAAEGARGLVADWLGAKPERQAVLLDHDGQPYATGALLVQSASEAASPFAMTHLESHAWFQSEQVWLDEGMAQFLPILAIEKADGRKAALARIVDLQPALQLAESAGPGVPGGGESLVDASREVTYRNKAVAVLWMLREMVGDEAMKAALAELRRQPETERGAHQLQTAVERASKRDLGWFFHDWVYEDHGLPELTILSAAPRPVPGTGGRADGALVAVEVRNSGTAVADVPVTVRSGELTATERLRVPAGTTAAVRILFQGTPAEVQVNDGSVPEMGPSVHLRKLGDGE